MATRQESVAYYFQRWENKESQRYYLFYIARDLFDDWILTLAYGGLDAKSGSVTHYYHPLIERALTEMDVIAIKRKRRGYDLV